MSFFVEHLARFFAGILVVPVFRLLTWPFRTLFRKLGIGRGLGEAFRSIRSRSH